MNYENYELCRDADDENDYNTLHLIHWVRDKDGDIKDFEEVAVFDLESSVLMASDIISAIKKFEKERK